MLCAVPTPRESVGEGFEGGGERDQNGLMR